MKSLPSVLSLPLEDDGDPYAFYSMLLFYARFFYNSLFAFGNNISFAVFQRFLYSHFFHFFHFFQSYFIFNITSINEISHSCQGSKAGMKTTSPSCSTDSPDTPSPETDSSSSEFSPEFHSLQVIDQYRDCPKYGLWIMECTSLVIGLIHVCITTPVRKSNLHLHCRMFPKDCCIRPFIRTGS